MLDRFIALFVQEVPEELAVCEFDCPVTKCTVRNWAQCTLRTAGVMRGGVGLPQAARSNWRAAARLQHLPGRPLFLSGYIK